MRIALMSDIHGNSVALDAVIEGIERIGTPNADMLCVGHTRSPMNVEVDGVRTVNLGSVSNQYPPDRRASYIVVEATSSCVAVEYRRVACDHEVVVAELHRVRLHHLTTARPRQAPWRRLDTPRWI